MAKDDFNIDPKLDELSEKWLKNPQSRAFAPLADAYRKSGMLEEALNVCLEGLKIHPDYTSARIVLGKIYLDEEMIKDAETQFDAVIEKDPDNLVTLNYLGDIYYRQKRFLEALEKYERAKKLDPFNEQLKQRLVEVSRFCSQPVTEEPVAGKDHTPHPGAVDLDTPEAPEAEEDDVAVAEEPAAEPEAEESVPTVEEVVAVPEVAEEPEKVFTIEAEPVALEVPEPVEIEEVEAVEAEEPQPAAVEPQPEVEVAGEADVDEIEPQEEIPADETSEAEDGEKVYEIGEEVEPLDQIEFPPTPPGPILDEDEAEPAAVEVPEPVSEAALPVEVEEVEAVPEAEEPEPAAVEPQLEVEPVAETAEEEVVPEPAAEPEDKVYELDSELTPLGDVELAGDKGDDVEVATVTMARIYAKQGMINKAKVICLKMLSHDPNNTKAKQLFTKLQGLQEGMSLADAPAEVGEPEKTTPASALKGDDEPLIDFRESAGEKEETQRSQTIYVGDLNETDEEDVEEAYRGTMMDVDFGASESEDAEGEEEPEEKPQSDMAKWLDKIKDDNGEGEEGDH